LSKILLFTLLQSTQLYICKWGPGVDQESSPLGCNINGYLVVTEKVNVKLLSMPANGCGSGGTLSAHTITMGYGTAPPAKLSPRWICQHWLIVPE